MMGATQFFAVCSDEARLTFLVLRAFADLGVDILQDLKSDRMKLTSLVLQHIAGVLVNNVTITVPDWTASNGAYHRISEVLFRDQL